jgi:hypothetical protein
MNIRKKAQPAAKPKDHEDLAAEYTAALDEWIRVAQALDAQGDKVTTLRKTAKAQMVFDYPAAAIQHVKRSVEFFRKHRPGTPHARPAADRQAEQHARAVSEQRRRVEDAERLLALAESQPEASDSQALEKFQRVREAGRHLERERARLAELEAGPAPKVILEPIPQPRNAREAMLKERYPDSWRTMA